MSIVTTDLNDERPRLHHVTLDPLAEAPAVAVVMPSFNQAAFIRDSIQSVISQDYPHLTLYIIDGASTDGTIDILRTFDGSPRVKWISETDSGVAEAVNKGMGLCTEPILAIQSSDDLYAAPDVVSQAVESFLQNPDTGMVYGNIIKESTDGTTLYASDFAPFSHEAFFLNETRIPQESCFFRREGLRASGGWREEVSYAADTDFFLRMSFYTHPLHIPSVFARRIMHPGQRYDQKLRIATDYHRMIDSNLGLFSYDVRLRDLAEVSKAIASLHYQGNHLPLRGFRERWTIQKLTRKWGYPSHTTLLLCVPGYWLYRKLLGRLRRCMGPGA